MESLIQFLRVAILIALLLAASVAVPLKLFGPKGLERVERLARELDGIEENNGQLELENQALTNEIRSFHSNPSYVEKVARDELGMVGPDEIIFQFPE